VINQSDIGMLKPLVEELLNTIHSGQIPARIESLNSNLTEC
jgi:hypothetical protein